MLARADRIKLASQNIAQPLPPLIAPVKGWNTRDALDAMDPADAVLLDNWFPDAGGVVVRNGFTQYATCAGFGGTGPVQTLVEYQSGATHTFLAACSGNWYDISGGNPSGALAAGFTNDKWQQVPFLGNTFLANGADQLLVYNGSTLSSSSFTGVSIASLVGCIAYQNRLFFWQNSSTGFWFAPLNSITGALSFFDLSPFTAHGGNLIAAATYSHDGGNGVLDFICFIMSSGDCLIYYGNDPSNVNNWQLIGIYRISPPVSARAVCNYGAEAFLTTNDDHVPLQQQLVALKNGALPPRSKVSSAVQAAVSANATGFGWQALYYPQGRRLIFNIPNANGTFSQHVQNTEITYTDTVTGATASPWCRFNNMQAQTWGLYKNNLYFGTAGGIIYRADIGTLDNLGPVAANGQQAWNTFGDPSRKRITAVRPVVQSPNAPYTLTLGFDYGALNISTPSTATPGVGSPWNTSPWNTSPWSTTNTVSNLWHAGGGTGVAVSVAVNVSSTLGAPLWLRTDFKHEKGATL
jgi:hypothetical protein